MATPQFSRDQIAALRRAPRLSTNIGGRSFLLPTGALNKGEITRARLAGLGKTHSGVIKTGVPDPFSQDMLKNLTASDSSGGNVTPTPGAPTPDVTTAAGGDIDLGGGVSTDDTTIADIFSGAIESAETESARLEGLLGPKTRDLQEELKRTLQDINREQELIFAPRFAASERAGQRAIGTARRGSAFAGFGRSTFQEEREQEINEMVAQQDAAIAAEKSAALRLQRAAARGASEEEITSLQEGVTSAKQRVEDLNAKMLLAEQELISGTTEAGQEMDKARLKARVDALKAGFDFDPETGEFTQIDISDPAKLQIKLETGPSGQVTAVVFNPETGDVTTSNLGGIGKGFKPSTAKGGGEEDEAPGGAELVNTLRNSVNPDTDEIYTDREISEALISLFPGSSAKATAERNAGSIALSQPRVEGPVQGGATPFFVPERPKTLDEKLDELTEQILGDSLSNLPGLMELEE